MKNGVPIIHEMKSKALYLEKIIADDKEIEQEKNFFLSEEEYRSIIELSSVGIFIGDMHGKIISWNIAMEKLTSISQIDAVGQKVWDVLYKLTPIEYKNPEYLIILENRMMSSINEWPYWQRQVSEQRITSLNGSDLSVKVSTFVTTSHEGNLLVSVYHDNSKQIQAERKLTSQNEALSKLNQFSIELSRLKLEDDMEALITKQIKEFTGAIGVIYSEYNAANRTLTPKHIELEPGMLEILASLLDNHVTKIQSYLTDYIYFELTKDLIGTSNSLTEISLGIIPNSIGASAQSLFNADRFIRIAYLVEGKLYGTSLLALSKNQPDPPMEILQNFVSLAAASLRHKRTEEALCRSEEMLRTITDNAADIILKLDNKGTILYTSRSFSGYKKEEIIGKNFSEWTMPEFHEIMNESLVQLFNDGKPQTFQSRALANNHEIRWYLSRLSPVVEDNIVISAVLILSDITEQKYAEEALRESEENYRVIAQSTSDVIFIVDRLGKQLFLNKSVEKVLGYKVEEMIGRSFFEFVPEENIKDFHSQLENVFLFKEACNFTALIYHKDGYPVDVEMNVTLVKLRGEYVGLGSIRDITARKRASEELQNSIERNKALLEANPDLMFVFNSNCKIVDFHSESHNQLLIEPEKFLGKLIDDILPHELVVETRQKVEKVLMTGISEYTTYELKIENKLKYFESRYVPCGKAEVLSIVRDITEQKNADMELNMAKESYQAIFNSVSEAIYILNEQGNFLDVNRGAEKMYLMNKEEFIGQSPVAIAAKGRNNIEEIQYIMERVAESGIPENFDFWAERKNGDVFLKEVIVNKAKYFGKNVLIAAARDITEKKRDEELLKLKNEELQNLNAEKDKFFSIIAHDLRSPLISFLGITKLLAEDLPNLTINEIQDMARGMEKSADGLFCLLENLLEWSRLQRGLINLCLDKLGLRQNVAKTVETLVELARKKEIEIENQIPEELVVTVDENMLASIIRNLVSNALKFTYKGGRIDIDAKSLDEDFVQVSISDNGIGMDADILNNIFNKNVQTSRQGTNGEPSSGLGLIICKDFIEKHNGKIWAESEEGKGSTFYFTLPVNLQTE